MAVKIFSCALTAAQVEALSANHFYWLDRLNNTTDTTQATLTANVSAVAPPSHAVLDLTMWDYVEMYTDHGALTNGVGGKLSVAALYPGVLGLDNGDLANPSTGAPNVYGATVDQALAATAESLITSVVNPPTAVRLIKCAVAVLWTTVPTAGTGLRVSVWGHRTGQDKQKG